MFKLHKAVLLAGVSTLAVLTGCVDHDREVTPTDPAPVTDEHYDDGTAK